MKNNKLGIVIVGAGAIASVHIDAYKHFPDLCEIRAVCDLFPDKAKQLVEENGLNAQVYTDYHEALKREDVDAVSICLPPSMHASISIDSLNAGKHVLCEKPMAASLEECDAMLQAARENCRMLSIVAQNRYKTPVQKVKKLIEEGTIGRVLFTIVNSIWWRGENYYDIWWRGTWAKETGGCVANQSVHHIDMLQWMLGMPKQVNAILANVGHHNSECEDISIATLRYPDMVAQLSASLVSHGEEQELVFSGEKGSISIPWKVHAAKAQANGFPEPDDGTRNAIEKRYHELPALELEGHPAQVKNFLHAINGDEPLLVDGVEGRKAIELITAIYKAGYSEQTVTLPIQEDDIFYRKGGIAEVMPHFHEKTKSVDNFAATKPISLGRDVGQ